MYEIVFKLDIIIVFRYLVPNFNFNFILFHDKLKEECR